MRPTGSPADIKWKSTSVSKREGLRGTETSGLRGTETSIPDSRAKKAGFEALPVFMPRMARAVAVGVPHHVTQRGNNRQRIFDSDQDRLLYLKILGEYSARHGLFLWGYCLMDNHLTLEESVR